MFTFCGYNIYNEKREALMGYGLILAGMAFLFVPSFGIYDVMPDVIGYALIMIGLSKTARLNGDLARVQEHPRP